MGKIRVREERGARPSPRGRSSTAGKPTRDPNVMYAEPHGALVPFGGHKGYALAVMTELLAGALTGGPASSRATSGMGGVINNMFTVLIDPAASPGVDWLRREIDGLHRLREGVAAGRSEAARPGARRAGAHRAGRARLATGIEVDATTWAEIVDAATTVGLTRAEVATLSASVGLPRAAGPTAASASRPPAAPEYAKLRTRLIPGSSTRGPTPQMNASS